MSKGHKKQVPNWSNVPSLTNCSSCCQVVLEKIWWDRDDQNSAGEISSPLHEAWCWSLKPMCRTKRWLKDYRGGWELDSTPEVTTSKRHLSHTEENIYPCALIFPWLGICCKCRFTYIPASNQCVKYYLLVDMSRECQNAFDLSFLFPLQFYSSSSWNSIQLCSLRSDPPRSSEQQPPRWQLLKPSIPNGAV